MFRILNISFFIVACSAPTKPAQMHKPQHLVKEHTHKKEAKTNTASHSESVGNEFHIQITHSATGFGYQIYEAKKLVIDQATIPGRPGLAGFQNEEEARKVAELVKFKLEQQVFPPSVSEAELKNLNIH
jgi:hypothetical protein